MATDNNIKSFSAADIERYHKGQLSAKERHDLEKAALDDPFLADALEGYTVAGQDAQSHLADLRTRLAEKVEGAKVVPIAEKKKRPVAWLRIAALVIIIAGAALLANQFVFKSNKKEDIAKAEQKNSPEVNSPDTSANVVANNGETKDDVNPAIKTDGITKGTTPVTHEAPGEVVPKTMANELSRTDDAVVRTQPATTTTNPVGTGTNPLPATTGADNNKLKTNDAVKEKTKDVAATERKEVDKTMPDKYYEDAMRDKKKSENVTANRRAADNDRAAGLLNQQSNTFRGQVTDANNVGVPFANVTNALDNNAGTYTDAKGYFNLTYPDSVLTVQVRSIGFENRNVQLTNAAPSNRVILQDDRSLAAQTLPSPNADSAKQRYYAKNNVKLEEPEPADGWENYDTYLANNLNAPEEIRTKQMSSGQVQVSFEVNKEGEPINIRIEKSLCAKCDEEAKRLIKEGPKWKRNANKKGRTMVTINF